MRFARISAAGIVLIALLSPLKHGLRIWALPSKEASGSLDQAINGIHYLVVLAALYVGLIGLSWSFRAVLRLTDRWQEFGLADLDSGVRGLWSRRWAFAFGVLLLASATIIPDERRAAAIPEAVVAAIALYAAMAGSPAEPQPIEEYDPLPPLPIPPPSPAQPEPVEPRTPGPAPEPVPSIPLRMAWYFKPNPGSVSSPAREYTVALQASRQRYEKYQAENHDVHSAQDYARFVTQGLSPEVDEIARQLRAISTADSLNTIAEINNVLAFAQRFRYVLDQDDKGVPEYPKYPLETFIEDRGDCEDHAIAAAACLLKLGYLACLVSVIHHDGSGHMALAIAGATDIPDGWHLTDSAGRKFYYCEVSTNAASREAESGLFRMGEIPAAEKTARLALIPLTVAGG